MIKLLIFDLDGTLLNTIEDIKNSLNKSLEYYSLPTYDLYNVKRMVGNGVDVLIQRAIKDNADKFNAVKEFYLNDYNKNCAINTKPYDGIMEVLLKLKEEGYKLAVLSNKPHIDTKKVIDSYFGNNIFDYVIGKKEQNRIKPFPDGVNEVIKYFEYDKKEVVFIGDSEVDVETAINSNILSIAVLWGFREKEELLKADYFAYNANDIIKIIKGC